MTALRRCLVSALSLLTFLQMSMVALADASASTTPGLRVTTTSYVFTLTLGTPQHMWTPAQVKMMHPKMGDVVLRGSMAGGMPMGGSQRDLEVHIDSRATGKSVVGAEPTIDVIDTSVTNPTTSKVPVDELEGVTAGASDLYYGNNVDFTPGHTYTIIVTLNGERGVLRAAAST